MGGARNLKLGATWGKGQGTEGQGKSLWVEKMSNIGHFSKTNISLWGKLGGKGKGTGHFPPPL